MNTAVDYTFETSKRDLAAEILKQAAVDLRRFYGATSAIERELYFDAHRWVASDDCSWPFCFLNVCRLLNLAPEAVREELLVDQSLGAFSYWIRRCRRATRKFQIVLSDAFTTKRRPTIVDPVPLTYAFH
jgi:hypothetical protein